MNILFVHIDYYYVLLRAYSHYNRGCHKYMRPYLLGDMHRQIDISLGGSSV